MSLAEDEHFAKQLQYELNFHKSFSFEEKTSQKENQNPVASILEITDPTPSIHDLLVTFDKRFFWSSLGMVQILWSHKMTSCAGVCSFDNRSGFCKISLSAPLLSLRPRKDLVETLLHEMIHAYLFVTRNYRDREDHGPEFHKHMYRINREAGTNITVYHSYHDEVAYYQRHVWRCDGPCRNKKPYFGFVRRAMNRAPGPSDSWWSEHKAHCNGTFIKVSEPEKPVKKSKKALVKVKNTKDIRDFFKSPERNNNSSTNSSNIKTLSDLVNSKPVGGMKTNSGNGTFVITNTNKNKKQNKEENNFKGKSLNNKTDFQIKSKTPTKLSNNVKSEDSNVKEVVRNFWANKFPSNPNPPSSKKPKTCEEEINICQATSSSTEDKEKAKEMKLCPVCGGKVSHAEMNEHLENCLNCSFVNDNDTEVESEVECESVPCPCCYKWFLESQMNSHIDECLTLNLLKEEYLNC